MNIIYLILNISGEIFTEDNYDNKINYDSEEKLWHEIREVNRNKREHVLRAHHVYNKGKYSGIEIY